MTPRSVAAQVAQPRPFGYVVGDLIEQRVLLQSGGHAFEPTALPKATRLGVWLDRRAAQVTTDAQGRRWLVVDYQLITAPQGLTTVNLPAWELVSNSGLTLKVPQWPVSVGPLTARSVIGQGGLQALRPDRPAPVIATGSLTRQLEVFSGAFVLTLLLWLGWVLWRNRQAARNAPFARAEREMRDLPDDSPEAWQALHRAFDRAAGRVVQPATLAALFERARYLEPLRPRIETFFTRSAEYFFGGRALAPTESVHGLCRELRRVERRSQP